MSRKGEEGRGGGVVTATGKQASFNKDTSEIISCLFVLPIAKTLKQKNFNSD